MTNPIDWLYETLIDWEWRNIPKDTDWAKPTHTWRGRIITPVLGVLCWLGPEPWCYYFRRPHNTGWGSDKASPDWYYFTGYPYRGCRPSRRWFGPVVTYAKTVWCRMRHHPAGSVYYNPGGCEPDPTCKNCGEETY